MTSESLAAARSISCIVVTDELDPDLTGLVHPLAARLVELVEQLGHLHVGVSLEVGELDGLSLVVGQFAQRAHERDGLGRGRDVQPDGAVEVRDRLRDLREQGKTFMVIEHDMELVRTVCERIVVMDAGGIVAEGTFDEIARNKLVVEAYLGGLTE